jgi:hypothetical protein
LLSKYLNPPSLPSTANYNQIKVMARTGDGRGPFVNGKPDVSPVYGQGSMKRRKNQQAALTAKRQMSSNLPPRAIANHPKISYRDQTDIMKQIFQNQNI